MRSPGSTLGASVLGFKFASASTPGAKAQVAKRISAAVSRGAKRRRELEAEAEEWIERVKRRKP